jgi:predicted glycoside hydrolase/deacetylase ChbG (UPF0249 family)
MRLILNADDFGACEDTVRATIACFDEGALTSATIMAGKPATAAALEFARSHAEHDFGVHLRLVADGGGDRPVCDSAAVPGLVDDDGHLLPTRTLRLRALSDRLPVGDVEREITSQIELVRDAGVEVSHVDSHRHVHKLPAVREALERVLPRFGIRRVRTVQDVYLRKPLTSPTFWVGRRWRGRLAAAFETTEHLYLPSSAHDVDWDEPLLERCARLSGRSLEVAVHPGSLEGWRDEERGTILRFAPAARAAGHELISWGAL